MSFITQEQKRTCNKQIKFNIHCPCAHRIPPSRIKIIFLCDCGLHACIRFLTITVCMHLWLRLLFIPWFFNPPPIWGMNFNFCVSKKLSFLLWTIVRRCWLVRAVRAIYANISTETTVRTQLRSGQSKCKICVSSNLISWKWKTTAYHKLSIIQYIFFTVTFTMS